MAFTPAVESYARSLIEAGFTVYAPAKPEPRTGWFHYSIDVDGQTCYGIFSSGESYSTDPDHTMPIKPSRLNGSGAHLHMDGLDPWSVDAARLVARPRNFCPYNAEPTREAIARSNMGHSGVPQKYHKGTTLPNAKPWGIGTHYVPYTPE